MSCSLDPEALHEALIDPTYFRRLVDGGELALHDDAPPDWVNEQDTWTVSEIAERLTARGHEVSVDTVRGWCRSGELATIKQSARGHYHVTRQHLRDFLDDRIDGVDRAA